MWLSQRIGVVMLIAIIGGLVPAFGFVSMAVAQGSSIAEQDFAKQGIAKVEAQDFNQFARIIIHFENDYNLPAYKLEAENGVLIVTFENAVKFDLPQISEIIPNFIAASRLDPDNKGVRFALKGDYKINKTEAGERLFLDILPSDWQGMLPSLPTEVVEELSSRAKNALFIAQQKQKQEFIKVNNPTAIVKLGRHPTFVRLIIDWSIDVKASYSFLEQKGELLFDWPVAVDLSELKSDLPNGIISVDGIVSENGSKIIFELEKQITPRFYEVSKNQYIIDIDLNVKNPQEVDLASLLPETAVRQESEKSTVDLIEANNEDTHIDIQTDKKVTITPLVEQIGSTIRLTFPFEQDTAAAVFRRGDMLWMVFDTEAVIGEPAKTKEFSSIASEFSVVGAGQTSIVRIDLRTNRLATLGSEGQSWVLSLGDVVLSPLELISLDRKQSKEGLFEIVADLKRAANVHQIRDPLVGDILEVVTSYPPAIGVARDLSLVDFNALRSVHGLVIKPLHDDVIVEIIDGEVIISAKKGLIVSTSKGARSRGEEWQVSSKREGFLNLSPLIEKEPEQFFEKQKEIMQRIDEAERNSIGAVRLQLAQYYLANQLYYEALGMLNVIDKEQTFGDLGVELAITRAAANIMASRLKEANSLLKSAAIEDDIDAMIWRTITQVKLGNFAAALKDALSAEIIITDYPKWVKTEFYLAASEAALEVFDIANATRFITLFDAKDQNVQQINEFKILLARIDEAEGRFDLALEGLGQVISADNRPTKAKAVYYTMLILKRMGRLDSFKGAEALAFEAMIWRGDDLEVKMNGLLGDLYFDTGSFREAFEVSKQVVKTHPTSEAANSLLDKSQAVFANLFLNGEAEQLPPIEALSLYYDYRYLTPAGARGDEMIRSLARRLVKVDLLEQASELLQYQVDERLDGVAKAQIAADLAVIYLADRLPQKAIAVLNDTQLSGIPLSLQRQRRILEARALIDVGREELAIDMLSSISGKDASLLKIDAHWKSKRYQKSAEIIEQLYESELSNPSLSNGARANIIKAGVGFVLSDDQIGLTRLRLKYGELMSLSQEWGIFDFVTGQVNSSSLEFKKVAQQVANANSLKAFLNAYNESYGADGALSPTPAQ